MTDRTKEMEQKGLRNAHADSTVRGNGSTKVAVVTGASRGLGREIALTLNHAGYHVAVNYHLSKKEAEQVVRSMSLPSMAIRADVGNLREMEQMAGQVYESWGRVDLLINNAGIARDGLVIRYDESDWDEVMRVNLKGCFNAAKSFTPFMISSGGGHIIHVSSYSGLKGKAGQAAYSASKASVIGLTLSLAKELAEYNIKVNALLPGYMPTEMGHKAKEAMKKAAEESLLGTLSSPEAVSGFIAFLAATCTVTGQVFSLDSRI
ncbi:MAG TPA: SDR family NAD(P)-dependent oxidoreductase [Thermodesulfovibrionales bacterium]|nr:SDR family NAD(P)-dependent oxidoreductase [Thermodesulfovibrionales bacterium]